MCYGARMSERNGDRARFQKNRKRKLALRQRSPHRGDHGVPPALMEGEPELPTVFTESSIGVETR